MPYLTVLSEFREGVRNIAREQKGFYSFKFYWTNMIPALNQRRWKRLSFSYSDAAAAAVRRRPR